MASISSSLAGPTIPDFPSLFADIRQMERPLKGSEERRLYFATNEKNPERTIATLAQMPIRGNVVLAVSGIFALNILAARLQASKAHREEIKGLIIIDRSPVVATFWNDISKIIGGEPGKRKPGKEEVIQKIKSLIETKGDYFFSDRSSFHPIASDRFLQFNLRKFQREITNGSSFASTEERFKSIQTIFRKGHFRFLRLDLTNPASFQALGAVLRENRLEVDTAYFSNVLQFIDSPEVPNFHASTEAIMNPTTIIVDTEPVCFCEVDSKGYVQRVREREGLPASELFIPAVHDYGIFSSVVAVRDGIGFAAAVARRTIAATYRYFTGTSGMQVEA